MWNRSNERWKSVSRSVMSDFLWLHGLQPARLPCSWDFPGKNSGVLGISCSMRTFNWGMWDLVAWPGIERRPTALEARSLSHWTTREVLRSNFLSPPFYLTVVERESWTICWLISKRAVISSFPLYMYKPFPTERQNLFFLPYWIKAGLWLALDQ